MRGLAAFIVVNVGIAVDADYVVRAASKWSLHLTGKYPVSAASFRAEAASLGFVPGEIDKMWSRLAQISVIAGSAPDLLTAGSTSPPEMRSPPR